MPRDLRNEPKIIKLIDDIGLSIDYWKRKLGKGYGDSKEVKWLEKFRERVISGNSEAIFEDQFAKLKEELFESSKKAKGLKLEEKLANIKKQWEISKILNDHRKNKPKKLYETEEKIEARIQELKVRYFNLPQDALAEELAKLVLVLEVRHQDIETLTEEIDFLAEKLNESLNGRRDTVKKQNAKKGELFKDNNECMLACIKEVEVSHDDFPRKIHFRKFCEKLVSQYPVKPFQQAGSLSKEEKLQPKKIQMINRESNRNEKWSTGSLRTFFEKYIGRKITTLDK